MKINEDTKGWIYEALFMAVFHTIVLILAFACFDQIKAQRAWNAARQQEVLTRKKP